MIHLSKASHPNARALTLRAAISTFLDTLKPGPNLFPPVYDDVTGKGEVSITKIRATVKDMNKHLGLTLVTRVDMNGHLVIYLLEN